MKFKTTNGTGILCKTGFKESVVPYTSIKKAYIRVEEASATTCCARADFSSFFVMIVLEDGKTQKIQTDDRRMADNLIEMITKNNPSAEIGYQIS